MVGVMRNGLRWLLSTLVISQVQAFYIPGKFQSLKDKLLIREDATLTILRSRVVNQEL
jgi:hypothetical protein